MVYFSDTIATEGDFFLFTLNTLEVGPLDGPDSQSREMVVESTDPGWQV